MILLLLACTESVEPLAEGLGAEMAASVATCEPLRGGARGWCAVEAVEAVGHLDGGDVMKVCDRIGEPDAFDRCVELAARAPVSPADANECARIRTDLMRYSCYLSYADRSMTGTLQDAIAVCRKTGPLMDNCIIHIPTHRVPVWQFQGIALMNTDVAAILKTVPHLQHNGEFGFAVGESARNLGALPGRESACDAFPNGLARQSCEMGLSRGNSGRPQAAPTGSPY